MTPADDMDRDYQAAEYVLGTLRGAERTRFRAELERDAALRWAVAGWEELLTGLADGVAPVRPSPDLWARIERSIEPERGPGWVSRLWNSVSLWRATAALATAAACLLAFVALRPPEPGPALVAVLQAQGGPAFAVRIPTPDRVAVTPVGEQPPPQGQVYELWAVAPQAAPRSLGLIEREGVTQVPLERVPRELLRGGITLAVSLEPPGGSPTGAPTGPVLFTGTLVEAR
jgi:anti-sigma-K factor RskA